MGRKIWTFLGLYALLIAAAAPLALRLVPPNRFFGFRLPGTHAVPELWYAINAIGGKMFILSMVICAAINLIFLWRGLERALTYLGWINAALIVLSFWIVSQVLIRYLPG
jgi:hypothetical protein